MWELSSPSEAAIAVGQATKVLPVPAPSQPRRGSTAPTLDRCRSYKLGSNFAGTSSFRQRVASSSLAALMSGAKKRSFS